MRSTFYLLLLLLISSHIAYGQSKKYSTHLEGGVLTYGLATKELGYSFRGVESYTISSGFTAGIGVGFEKYMYNEVDEMGFKLLPIFAQVKYILKPETRKSLFGAFDLGHGVSLNKNEVLDMSKTQYKGGILASPQIGILFNTKGKKEFFTFSIGYKYQKFTEDKYFNYGPVLWNSNNPNLKGYDAFMQNKYNMNRISVMLVFGF